MSTVSATADFMHLTVTGAEPGYWTLTSDVSLPGVAAIAVVPEYEEPVGSTVWTAAEWDDVESVVDGVHTRVARLLLAGPNNGTNPGNPKVVPEGVWDTWVQIQSSPNRIERAMGKLVVGEG